MGDVTLPVEVALPSSRAPGERALALVVATAFFMEQLDSTVLTTALPVMAGSFAINPLHMSMALTAYLVSLTAFIPASGQVADRFGARRVFCGALALFTVSSVLCTRADTLGAGDSQSFLRSQMQLAVLVGKGRHPTDALGIDCRGQGGGILERAGDFNCCA